MERIGRVGAIVVGIAGAVVLVGWYSGIQALTTVVPGYTSMKPNTAVALVALAVAVTMLGRSRWTEPLGAFAILVGGSTLLEYLLGRSLGVDVLPGISVGGDSARMAPVSTVALVLLGSAVIAARRDRAALMRGLAVVALSIGHIAVLGYAYGVSSLYTVGGFTSMALHTALAIEVLALSILLLDPSAGLARMFRDRGSAGRLVRPMVPFLIIGPSCLGWLRLWAEDQGWFDTRFGVSFLVMSMTLLGGLLTWRATVSMRDLDRQRDAAVQSLADTNRTLEATVLERTKDLVQRQGFLDALLETIDVGIVSCDAEGKTLVRNRAERAMVGLDDVAQGLVPDDTVPAIDFLELDGRPLAAGQSPLRRALLGEDVESELLLGPLGGPYREVVVRGDRITGPDAEVLGAVVSVTDVTTERTVTRALAVEHSNLEEAQRLGQLGSFEFDFATESWSFSDQLCALWGVRPGGLVPELTQSLIHDEDRERVWQCWDLASSLGGSHTYQYRIHRADDGAERLIRSTIEIRLGPDGQPEAGRGTQLDITDLTQAQLSAQEASSFLEAVLAATPDYTFVTALATGAVIYGPPGTSILGMTGEELQTVGSDSDTDADRDTSSDTSDWAQLIHPEDRARLLAANADAADLGAGQVHQLLYRAKPASGQWRWLSRRVTPFRRDADGAVVEVLGVTRDVSDVVEAEEHLRHAALHDSLTGLPNRVLLVDRLDSALARSARDGREVSVLYCDLDGFKRVNDTAGHAAGDSVLVETAQRLRAILRPDDTVARVGGDEFVIVLEPWNRDVLPDQPNLPDRLPDRVDGGDSVDGVDGVDGVRDLALQVATRVTDVISQPIMVNGVEHIVTASVGIAYGRTSTGGRGEAVTSNGVLQDADAAMYRAKGRGKDRFEVFERALRTELAERGRVERVLRRVLQARSRPCTPDTPDARETADTPHKTDPPPKPSECDPTQSAPVLLVNYQPVFSSRTGALVSFEALARLTDAEGRDILPEVFIKVAEDVGMIRPLGIIVLEIACRQLAAWRGQVPGLENVTMAVNVSALQAQHASLGPDVRRALSAHGLRACDLVLELTESVLLHAAHSTMTTLRALRSEGVGIAIDDFGIGYASLRYLATLPVTSVKVDKSFVAGLPHDETSIKIVKAVAGLAADMDLTCVVEGVEQEEQRLALPAGVQLQGWLTGRPMAPQDLDVLSLVTFGAPNFAHWGGPTR